MIKILEGVKVLDFTTAAAGPICAKLLAELGAEDVMLEPVGGMVTRTHEPHQADFYLGGKKSLPCNIKTPEGMELMRRLVSWADVFISNYRAKALKKLGLDYESLKAVNPRLIYATLDAYGGEGPDRDKPGYDNTAFWARGGILADMAERGSDTAVIPSTALGDTAAGECLAMGICAALYRRERTGEGCCISNSLFGEAVWLNHATILEAQFGRIYPRTRKEPPRPLFNSYRCGDGRWITFNAMHHWEISWPCICNLIGREDLLDKYDSVEDTNAHGAAVAAALDEGFLKVTAQQAHDTLLAHNIPVEYIQHSIEVTKDEQAIANGMVFDWTLSSGEPVVMTSNPLRVNGERPPFTNLCGLGDHTVEMMRILGYSEEEIHAHIEKGIVTAAGENR